MIGFGGLQRFAARAFRAAGVYGTNVRTMHIAVSIPS
jgi:hypothetical protein